LMRDNGLKALQKRRFKRTTDCQHQHPIALNLLYQDYSYDSFSQKWGADISYIWLQKVGSVWQLCRICTLARLLAG
jgi:transposase InsO family protein